MPRGLFSGLLHEISDQLHGSVTSTDDSCDVVQRSFPTSLRRFSRGFAHTAFLHSPHAHVSTAFQEDAADKLDDEQAEANAAQAVTAIAQQANASMDSGRAAGPSKPKIGRWENTEGLPEVTTTSPSSAYVSRDIADNSGESTFRANLGCKCGDWRPAASHPQIEIREQFIADHPDFVNRVQKLQVHMEDVTDSDNPVVHWDAKYDVKKFLDPLKAGVGGKMTTLKLEDTIPAEPGSGEQIRFMTFCPPEGGQDHTYELKVTALDAQDNKIEDLNDDNSKSTYTAKPPLPEELPQGVAGAMVDSTAKAQMKKAQGQLQVAQAEVRQGESLLKQANDAQNANLA